MIKVLIIMVVIMFAQAGNCSTVITLNGYYHNESLDSLSIKKRVMSDISLANRILQTHNVHDYRFELGAWKSIDVPKTRFYKSSLDGEAHMAYVAIKSQTKTALSLDFYVRGFTPLLDGAVRGVAVQEGNFFAFTYQGYGTYYTFVHELFHMIGLGESNSLYASSYACGAKVTLMDERHLDQNSKTPYLSDPNMVVNGQRCGHETHYDNARKLRELLLKRFAN